jgi:hypothetical protein
MAFVFSKIYDGVDLVNATFGADGGLPFCAGTWKYVLILTYTS